MEYGVQHVNEHPYTYQSAEIHLREQQAGERPQRDTESLLEEAAEDQCKPLGFSGSCGGLLCGERVNTSTSRESYWPLELSLEILKG